MTSIRSAERMVDRRWAITKLIRPRRIAAIPDWITSSVSVSTELVASSMTNIFGSARIARANEMSCFCPTESLPPPSPTCVW